MRQLTFRGFLKKYVYTLSYSKSYSVRKLTDEAVMSNPRMREALFLYAFFTDSMDTLLEKSKPLPELHEEYSRIASRYCGKPELLLKDLEDGNETALPPRYLNTYTSYLSKRNAPQRHAYTHGLMCDRLRELQLLYGVSAYRLYTDLHLNPGNVNAYLKHRDCSKVSCETARSMLAYVEARKKA